MRAAVLIEKRKVVVKDVEEPQVGPQDVLIAVKSSGVCGTDVHMYEGEEGSTDVVMPLIMGHEFSGVVEDVGPEVTSLKKGDKVSVNPNIMCGHCHFCRAGKAAFCVNHRAVGVNRPGGFGQRVAVPFAVAHKFERADFTEAAMIEPLSCCMNVFEVMPFRIGDAYLVVGGGPIGMMMLQLCRLAGARFVAVAELVEGKREKCLNLGADAAFDPRADTSAGVAARAGIRQYDAVIDCVGTPTQKYSLEQAGRGTRVMFFGIGAARDALEVHPYRLFVNQAPVYSSFINPYTFERTVELVESGKMNLKPIVSERIGLEALEPVLADPKRRSGGKVLVEF